MSDQYEVFCGRCGHRINATVRERGSMLAVEAGMCVKCEMDEPGSGWSQPVVRLVDQQATVVTE